MSPTLSTALGAIPPTGMPFQALIKGFTPCLIVPIMLCLYDILVRPAFS